jgi:hypothetical protein
VMGFASAQPILRLIVRGQPQKLLLHGVDAAEIARHEVIAAALAGHRPKTAAHKSPGGPGAAQMDEGGEILFLLRARDRARRGGEHAGHLAIEIDRRKRDGVAGQRPGVEALEPAIGHDDMPADAGARGLGKGRVGHLEQADGARGGPVPCGRIPAPPPAPVGARDRIAGALGLRQCRQQFGRDVVSGEFAEPGAVLPPGVGGLFVEHFVGEKQQLGRFSHHLPAEVDQRQGDQDCGHDNSDAERFRRRSPCATQLCAQPAEEPDKTGARPGAPFADGGRGARRGHRGWLGRAGGGGNHGRMEVGRISEA